MKQNEYSGTSPSRGPTTASEFVEKASESVQRMLRAGSPPREILVRLVAAAEELAGGGATSSILVIGEDGLLHDGASPNLPPDYLAAIDCLKPDARVGTCAAAAATGMVVITEDFRADDKWAELRHLPLALGFTGAWSVPIKDADGTVLGTFGTYFRESRCPTPGERKGVQLLADAAAIVLARA